MKQIWILTIAFLLIVKNTSEAPISKEEYNPLVEQIKDSEDPYEITNDILVLHPAFRNKVIDLIYLCHKEGIELSVRETHRSVERQNKLNQKRPRVTFLKGGESKHQYGLAIDVCPVVNGKLAWNDKALWKKIGSIGESLGLQWGGRWRRIHDPGHFEWKCSQEDLLAGNMPAAPDTVKIPIGRW